MKKLLLSAFVAFAMLASTKTFAQQGFGTNSPDKSAAVDIISSKRGLLVPRLDLSNITVASPVEAPAHGLLVYNKATSALTGVDVANNVTPGFYYWERNDTTTETAWQGKWVRIVSSNTEKKVIVEEGNNVKVVEDVTGLTTTYTVSVDGGTKNGQVLVSVPNTDTSPGAEPFISKWVDANDFIKGVNGINITTDTTTGITNVGIGGALTDATGTEIITDPTTGKTLAITGLEVLDNAGFDPATQNIMVMGADGILKQVAPKILIDDAIAEGNLAAKSIKTTGGIITLNGTSADATNTVLQEVTLGIADKSIGVGKLDPGTATPGQIATVVEPTLGNKEIQYVDPSTAIGKTLTTDNIIGVGATLATATANSIDGAVLTPTYLKIKDNSITAAQIATGAVGANELATGAVTADKLSTKDSENGTAAPENTVPVANNDGTVTYKTIAAAAGENLTTDGKIVIGTTGTSQSLTDAVLVTTHLRIAPESITSADILNGTIESADIKDGTITTTDIQAPGSATNEGGDENMVMVTDTNGNVTWIEQSALGNKDSFTGTAPISVVAATGTNATGGKDYTISVATAGTNLGVVKQADTNPEIAIGTDGGLSVNEVNVNVGLNPSTNNPQGDVSGTLSNLTVAGIQGIPVSNVDPTSTNNMLVYNSSTNLWEPSTVAKAAGENLTTDGKIVIGNNTSNIQSLDDAVLVATQLSIKLGSIGTGELATGAVTAEKLVAATDGTDLNKIPVANLNGTVEYKDAATALGKQLSSTSINISNAANKALLEDLTIDIKPGTAANQILTTIGTPGNLTTSWATPNSLVTVDNGLNKDYTDIELGGALKRTTVITTGGTTNPTFTLGVKDLVVPTTDTTEIMYAEGSDGVLRKAARSISQAVGTSQAVNGVAGYNDFVQEINITATIGTTDINITFPSASLTNKGQVVTVKIDNPTEPANYVNIIANGGTLTYGGLPYQGWIVKSNGSAWEIVGRN